MKNSMQRGKVGLGLLMLAVGMLACAGVAQAELLVYEPFAYTAGTPSGPTLNGVQLNGQAGAATGLTGSWSAWTNNSVVKNQITVYPSGSNSGVNLTTTTALLYDGTVPGLTLPTGGGYVGMGGTNVTDHMLMSRTLDPSVTAKFVDGATTWFSFVSVRGYATNPAGMKLALGKGALIEDRGQLASGEAIGGGGGLGSSVLNGYKIYPQFWDATTGSPGETSGTFKNYDVGGANPNGTTWHALSAPFAAAGYAVPPTGQTEGLDSMLLNYVPNPATPGVPSQINGDPNIVVGKIEWHDGAPDVISVVRFSSLETLTEAAFNALILAQPNLSSANWVLADQPNLDQSQFDTLSLAGGKWFVDEVRLGTTPLDVGLTPVPEPGTVALLATAGLALLGFGWRKRK